MVLQVEDCINVMRVLYPQFDTIFYFDHSCGHNWKRPDGLTVNGMNSEWGGTHQFMRDTEIEDDTYLGPYEKTLHVGSVQSMVFKPDNVGPFYMDATKRLK